MPIFPPHVMAQPNGYANFAAFASEQLRANRHAGPNPYTQARAQQSRKRQLQLKLGVAWYQGGWMEDRTELWSDIAYLKQASTFLHLGVDCSVDAGTDVLAPRDGEIVYVGDDSPAEYGWGGHVLQMIDHRGERMLLILAHLDRATCGDMRTAKAGDLVGRVGTRQRNGNWGEHLHMQLWRGLPANTDWQKFMHDIDGYGDIRDIDKWAKQCPDPTPLIYGG